MALTLGELVGYVGLDASGLKQGAAQGETAVGKMTSDVLGHLSKVEAKKAVAKLDADAAGVRSQITEVEGELARLEGMRASPEVTAQTNEAKARLNDLYGQLGRIDSQRAEVKVSVDDSGVSSSLRTIKDKLGELKPGGLAIGAGVGAAVGVGFSKSLTVEAAQKKLQAQLGDASYAQHAGAAAGTLYADAYGESLEQVNEAVRMVISSGAVMEDASKGQIESITAQAMSLSTAFEVDVSESMLAVSRMIKAQLVPDAQGGIDLITRAFQQLGPGAHDILDTFTEYSVQFQKVGLDGSEALGMIQQMMHGGARSTDLAADALKEFSIRAIDGSKTTADAFEMIGLDAGVMARRLAMGGESANFAFTEIINKLKEVDDPVKQSAAAVGLFGTQAEDLGSALYSIDPTTAVAALGEVEGAGKSLNETIEDTAQNKITAWQRSFDKLLVSFVGAPGIIGQTGAVITAFGADAVGMAGNLGMVALALRGVDSKILTTAKTVVMASARIVAEFVKMSVAAAVHTGKMIGHLVAWAVATAVHGAKAVAAMAVTAAAYVLHWTVMAAGAMARAAVMAAAWLVAMGPVGWVIAGIAALVALIIWKWDEIAAATEAAWNWVTEKIGAAWDWIKGKVADGVAWVVEKIHWFKQLPGKVADWFGRLKDAAITKLVELVGWLTGLPGRILGAIGDLGRLLWDAGKSVVTGLWNGIKSAASWLYNKIMGWIRDVIPGPILRFLGIGSPSKWAERQVGRWIGPGIAEGIRAGSGDAERAALALASRVGETLTVALKTVVSEAAAGSGGAGLSGPGRAARQILDRLRSGGQVFEDFSFQGDSALVRRFNDQIAAAYAASGSTDPQRWLAGYISSQRMADTAARPTIDPGELAAALRGAINGARLEIDGRGAAKLVNRTNRAAAGAGRAL